MYRMPAQNPQEEAVPENDGGRGDALQPAGEEPETAAGEERRSGAGERMAAEKQFLAAGDQPAGRKKSLAAGDRMAVGKPLPAAADQLACDGFLQRMQQGDTEAFKSLYETAARAVYAYALSILQNPQDAEEAMQDTFLTVWTQCDSYVSSGKPLAWIFTIVRNRCYALLRRRSVHPSVSLESLDTEDPSWQPYSEDLTGERSAARDSLAQALACLTDQERRLIYLHVIASMKHREIAAALGLPLATVLSRYHRAVRKLRRELIS